MRLHFRLGGRLIEAEVHPAHEGYDVIREGRTVHVALDAANGPIRRARVDGRAVRFGYAFAGDAHEIHVRGGVHRVALHDPRREALAGVLQPGAGRTRDVIVTAPIPGLVKAVLVKPGEAVKEGQPLLKLDAMKLENEIPAPRAGRVKAVHVKPGAAVEKEGALVTLS